MSELEEATKEAVDKGYIPKDLGGFSCLRRNVIDTSEEREKSQSHQENADDILCLRKTKCLKKKLMIAICIVLVIALSVSVFNSIQTGREQKKLREEFENLVHSLNTEAEDLILPNMELIQPVYQINLDITSDLQKNKYHDWYDWNQEYNIELLVDESFDSLTAAEQHEIISSLDDFYFYYMDDLIDEVYPRYKEVFYEVCVNRDIKIYERFVVANRDYNIYIKTPANKYCELSFDSFSKNGIIVSVKSETKSSSNYVPYEGMDVSLINRTSLGPADKCERCRDYYALRPEHRSITYTWYKENGKLLFSAFVMEGKVVSVVDLRK